MRFQPGDQGELHVTPSLIVFEDGIAYQFTVETATGNSFSHTVVAETGSTWMGYEKLEITGITWTPNSAFAIVVENTGTEDVTVNHIKVNHVGIATGSVSPATPFTFKTTDSAKTITVTYTYTNGSAYDISVVTSTGHEFTDHFTGGQDESVHATGQAGVWLDYDAVSWNAGNITIYLRNKGTSDAEIDAVYVGTSYESTIHGHPTQHITSRSRLNWDRSSYLRKSHLRISQETLPPLTFTPPIRSSLFLTRICAYGTDRSIHA